MSGFTVSVARELSGSLPENGGTMPNTVGFGSETTCGSQSGALNRGDRIRIQCQPFPVVGRYVIVSLAELGQLSLCEVVVAGYQDIYGKV